MTAVDTAFANDQAASCVQDSRGGTPGWVAFDVPDGVRPQLVTWGSPFGSSPVACSVS